MFITCVSVFNQFFLNSSLEASTFSINERGSNCNFVFKRLFVCYEKAANRHGKLQRWLLSIQNRWLIKTNGKS